ncbi:hypothetical protein GCM10020254_56790 [Streptomyces goshikiensis]
MGKTVQLFFMELERLGRELQDEGLVSRACTDRYVPEIARYGGLQGIALAEELFGIDSDLVSDLLAASPSEERRLFHAVSALLDWIRGFYGDSPGEEQLVGILRRRVSPREKGGRLGSRYGAYFREVRKPLDVFLAERTTPHGSPCRTERAPAGHAPRNPAAGGGRRGGFSVRSSTCT